jgi:putative NIF3 family GTP cyclohydrolase 1 type 2
MNLQELCQELDKTFAVGQFDEREYWQGFLSESYRGTLQRFLRPDFANGTWNGLMLENAASSGEVERVYLAVFPSESILDTIIANEVERSAPGAMIFTHHPLDYSETKGVFQGISVAQMEELHEHHISVYACHVPLDCHPEISTARALADALRLQELAGFATAFGKNIGIHGTIASTTFQDFATRLAKICELPRLRYDQCLHIGRPVQHIAIVPGGNNNRQYIDDALHLGIDTYVTGLWWSFGSSDFAEQNRDAMRSYLKARQLNLLGASQYSSEMVVLRDEMPAWFKKLGVETMLMRQQDPWQ